MAAENPDLHPPKPRLTLRVGVTGKRAIPDTEAARIRAALGAVFDSLAVFLAQSRRDHQTVLADRIPLLRLVSGMAEGADQIAASVAIERFARESTEAQRTVETRLAAILPFPRKEYEKDFEQDPNKPKGERERTPEQFASVVAAFERMLADPATESVFEIDDETILNTSNPDDRNIAYANLRDVLLEHTDLLVAVSDDVDGGAGGTVDVIRIAVREGIPVVKISTKASAIIIMRPATPDEADQTPKDGEELVPGAALPPRFAAMLDLLLAPPKMPPPEATDHLPPDRNSARRRIEQFFDERFKPAYFDRIFKSFRNAFGTVAESHWALLRKAFTAFRAAWGSYRDEVTTPAKAAARLWLPEYDRFSADGGAAARTILAERHGWADSLAVRYADATRSAHILLAALGALAVLMAVVPLVLPEEHRVGLVIKAFFLALEFAVLIAALLFFYPARRQRWHERMVEYRAVAELLRHERFIYALGAADRPGRAVDRNWSEPDAWVGWYVRATLRELAPPTKVLHASARRDVLDTFLKDELRDPNTGQIGYNDSVDKRFHRIDHRLEAIVARGFLLTLCAALFGIVFIIVVLWTGWGLHGGFPETVVHIVKPTFTLIAAFVPALIAAIHGIRFQIEFKSMATRAGATKRDLEKVASELEAALAKPPPAPGRKQSVQFVRNANEAMAADLNGWSSVYRGKGPQL